MTFYIKQNDTQPAFQATLKDGAGDPINLTNATVRFQMRESGADVLKIDAAASVISALSGIVRYTWGAADTNTAGFFDAEFVVTYSDNTVETFPNNEYITIRIEGDETGRAERINNVRFLVGDTDATDYAITNDNVSFALTQAGDDVYLAAAICARALAGKYATYVDTKFEDVSSDYSQMSENYYKLATRLEAQSKKYGSRGLGLPAAGGLTYSDIEANDLNDNRVQPKFKQDQFANPPRGYDPDIYGY